MDRGCVVCVCNQLNCDRLLVDLINRDMFDIIFFIYDCLIAFDLVGAPHYKKLR